MKEICEIVNQTRFISSTEIHRLVGGNLNTLQVNLNSMFHSGYLDRPEGQQELALDRGTNAIVYAPGRGCAVLLGEPLKKNETGLDFLEHIRGVTRLYMVAHLGGRRVGIQPSGWVTEAPLPPLRIPGRAKPLSPYADAACFLPQDDAPSLLFAEVDFGTEPVRRSDLYQSSIKKKFIYYIELFRQSQELLGTKSVRALFICPTQKKLESYRALARELDPKHAGLNSFWFCLAEHVRMDEPELFYQDICFTPSQGPFSLVRTPVALGPLPLYKVALPE